MFTTSANFMEEILGEVSNHQEWIESTVAVVDALFLFLHVFVHLPLCMGLSIMSYLDKSTQLIASWSVCFSISLTIQVPFFNQVVSTS